MEEVFKKLQEAFVDAGKKEEFLYVAAALQANFDPEKVERFMNPKLDANQLMEQLAGMADGLPEQTLSVFAGGKLTASEMKQMRLGSRSDGLMDLVLQEIRNTYETLTELDYRKELSDVAKMCKEVKKELKELSKKEQDRPLTEEGKVPVVKLSENNNQQGKIRKEADADKPEMEESIQSMQKMEEQEQEAQTFDYISDEGILYETSTSKETVKDGGILAFFRRLNAGKVERREEKKRLAVMEFVKAGMDEAKLTAVLEAVRQGVPYDHLQHVIDKESSPEKIRTMTKIYLYLFDDMPGAGAAMA